MNTIASVWKLALAIVAVALAVPAFADDMVTGSSLDLIMQALKDNNFTVEHVAADDGTPLIRSTDDNDPFSIHFYGCDDNHENCTYIQFVSGWNMKSGISMTKVAEWNATRVWGQAWRDSEDDPWVAVTVNLKGGISYDNFSDTVDWWRFVMRDYEKYIGWKSQ